MALSYRQRIFVEKYIGEANFVASNAVKLAGYKCKDAAHRGCELLKLPEVKALVDARVAEMAMSANEVLLRLTEQARGAWAEYIEADELGRPRVNINRMRADGKLHLLRKVSVSAEGIVTVETYDSQSALQLIGRVHGMFVDKTALTDPSGDNAYDAFAGIKEQLFRRLDRLAAAGDAPAVPGEPES